jgi:uncharacterized protein YndB with AHSA1/START domain
MNETKKIIAKVALATTLPKVWSALTEPEVLKKWFLREATIQAVEDGSYHFSWGVRDQHGNYPVNMRGSVLRAIPEQTLQITWNSPDHPVAFELQSNKDEVFLSVTAEGFINGSEGHIFELRGWTFYLINLKTVLEREWDLREEHPERTLMENWVNYFSLR